MTCPHPAFEAEVDVSRISSTGRLYADVRIVCRECRTPMRFIGLPAGIDMNGAAVSADGTEARLAIAPYGEVISAMDGAPHGFTVRRDDPGLPG